MRLVTYFLVAVIILLVVGHFMLVIYMEPTEPGLTTASVMLYYEQIFGETPEVICDWQLADQPEAERCVQIPVECVRFPTASYSRSFSTTAFGIAHPKVVGDWLGRGLCWPKAGAWLPSLTDGRAYGRSMRPDGSCEHYETWKAAARQFEPDWIEEHKSDIPAYYINARKDKERDTKVRQVLERIVTKFRRIEGRDIYEPGFEANYSHLAFRESARSRLKISEMKVVAILLSHREAIQTAYDNGDTMALIFEDDLSMELAPMWTDTIDSVSGLQV
jgi:hypothetical protein